MVAARRKSCWVVAASALAGATVEAILASPLECRRSTRSRLLAVRSTECAEYSYRRLASADDATNVADPCGGHQINTDRKSLRVGWPDRLP